MSAALVLEGVHKSFGEHEVLKGIDLAVGEHEVVCLIGASGSGKSTLLRCVNLLEPIDAGRIVVDGRDQFRLWGAFRSGPLAKVALRYARENALEASVVLPGRIRHVRRLEWEGSDVHVFDTIEGSGRHRVVSRLLLAPDAQRFDLSVIGGSSIEVERAWVSERFGERLETAAHVVAVEQELPAQLGFQIVLGG